MTTDPNSLAAGRAALERLWSRGRDFLGVEIAIMGGAMSWVSERNLVSAISNAGGFGVVACGSMTPDLLRAEIDATYALTDKPFGVNLITMHPDLDALIAVCLDRKIDLIVLAGGLPPASAIGALKGGGARVMCFAPALALAKKLVRMGVDGLVIEGMEAGGHIGPVSTSVLAQEILPVITEVPVFVAGGVGRGEVLAAYLEMGAAGCQIGTRLVCATESIAHPAFKKRMIRANARDAQTSVQLDVRFPVIPVRAITNQASTDFIDCQRRVLADFQSGKLDQKAAQLEIEHFWVGALRRAVIDGDIENGSLMAGQSVGMIRSEQPTAEILAELSDQAAAALAERVPGRASAATA